MDDEDARIRTVTWSEVGTILIAAIFALGGLYLMIGPSPFAALYAVHKPAQAAEISVGIGGAKPAKASPPP
jgi:hypothetical protein